MIGGMGLIQLREIREDDYKTLYSHMKRDFPSNELAPFFAIKRNFKKNIYDGFYMTENGADIGYAVITSPEHLEYALINYFAVLPKYRSKGYGTAFLQNIFSIYPDRIFIVEVDNPSAAKTNAKRKEAVRRVRFYERAGFHVMPTVRAKIFGVDMLIMASVKFENMNAKDIMHSLYLSSFGSKKWLKFIDILQQ